jgi:hypothetical protein
VRDGRIFTPFSVHLMYYQFFLSLPCVYFFSSWVKFNRV